MTTNNGTPMGVGGHPGGPPPNSDEDRIRLAALRTKERTRAIQDIAAEGFAEQPTATAIRAAGRRLCASIAALAEDMAKAKERAA